jgi:hypothetical protein
MIRSSFTAVLLLIGASTPVLGASIPDTCQSAKHKEAGNLLKCMQSAEAKFVLTGDAVVRDAAVAGCLAKFADKWQGAEDKAVAKGDTCQTVGDRTQVQSAIEEQAACLAVMLETGSNPCAPSTCGDGVLNAGEDCDFGQAGTGTCSSETGATETVGELSCGAGCLYDTSACSACNDIGGQLLGGACWFVGAEGDTCTEVCASHELRYDSATRTYAGSDGSDANCTAVLNALGISGSTTGAVWGVGLGCFVEYSGFRRDYGSPTTADASHEDFRRACACH